MTYKQLLDLVLKTEGYHLDKPVKVEIDFETHEVTSVTINYEKDANGESVQSIVLTG